MDPAGERGPCSVVDSLGVSSISLSSTAADCDSSFSVDVAVVEVTPLASSNPGIDRDDAGLW